MESLEKKHTIFVEQIHLAVTRKGKFAQWMREHDQVRRLKWRRDVVGREIEKRVACIDDMRAEVAKLEDELKRHDAWLVERKRMEKADGDLKGLLDAPL